MAEKDEDDNKKMVVKSNAVVKYSLLEALPKFAQLRLDTDLKVMPENWLLTNVQRGHRNLPLWFLLHPRKVTHEFSRYDFRSDKMEI
jgi:hypothetical protein